MVYYFNFPNKITRPNFWLVCCIKIHKQNKVTAAGKRSIKGSNSAVQNILRWLHRTVVVVVQSFVEQTAFRLYFQFLYNQLCLGQPIDRSGHVLSEENKARAIVGTQFERLLCTVPQKLITRSMSVVAFLIPPVIFQY